MPIYEYQCRKCEKVFEMLQKVDEGGEAVKCPYCGGQKPEKILSRFSSVKEVESTSSCEPTGHSGRFS